jgi:DNA (cytosine-5)-methyltransferase 1
MILTGCFVAYQFKIHFSAPCQDFSKANRHQTTGGKRDRADLSLLLVDLVRMTSCSTAVFENVVGIFDRNNVHYLKNISKGLLQLGYQIRCTCLHACNYGDPQKRPRIFMYIAKKSVPMPSFPSQTHGNRSGWNFITVKDALSRVEGDDSLPNMMGRNTSAMPGQHGFVRLMPYDCAPTIRASSVTPFHYSEDRCITVREAACLQSFPLDYTFLGSMGSQYRQVGNAVPVELSTAVGQSIRQILQYEYNDYDSDVHVAEE